MSILRSLIGWMALSLLAMLVAVSAQEQVQPPPAPTQQATQPATAPDGQSQPAVSQSKPSGMAADQVNKLGELSGEVDQIEVSIAQNDRDDTKLVEARLALENIQGEILQAAVAFRPRLAEINANLESLGAAPKDNEPAEAPQTTARRAELAAEKKQINVVLGTAEDLQIRVNGLINRVSTMRRDLFSEQLTKRYNLREAVSSRFGSEIGRELTELWKRTAARTQFLMRTKSSALWAATFFSILAGLVFQYVGRRFVGPLIRKDPGAKPRYLQRLSVAFLSTVLPLLGSAVFFAVALWLFDVYRLVDAGSVILVGGLVAVLLGTLFVNFLGRAVLSPDVPNWRLLDIEPKPAHILIWLMTLAAFIVAFDRFAGILSESLGSPLSTTIAKSLLAAVLVGIILLILGRLRPFVDADGTPRHWPGWLRLSLLIAGSSILLLAISGFISLSLFLARQIVFTGAWVATAYIGLLASRAISEEGAFSATMVGRWLQKENQTSDRRLDQLGVLSSIVINILIVLTFLPYVLFQWGYQAGDIVVWMKKLGNGFQIGTFTFSPLAILTGIIVFIIGYMITRWFQRWLDDTVMTRGGVDSGLRNSIRSIVGYAGVALAGLIAVSAAGLNLSNLALIAGGLSLGIGFGLQNVVSNFVSGLILLVERPFKVGDWIVASDVSGTVKKISVRATEIETFQRQTVTLPNSLLINGVVRNWTRRNRIGRVEIPVDVFYESDAEHVHRVLNEIAGGHPLVLKNPEPFVLFSGFTDTAMTFEIRLFLADVSTSSTVQNDMRFAILKTFQAEGIILAHTPRPATITPPNEHLKDENWKKDDDKAEAQLMDRVAAREASAQTGKGRRSKPDPS